MGGLWLLIGIGTLVGFAGGTLGVGGGFVLVPILVSWLGWPMIAAVATSQFCGLAVSTSATGNYSLAGLIAWRLAITMETASVAGSALGAWGARLIPADAVAVGFAIVACYAAFRMWQPGRSAEAGNDTTTITLPRDRYLLALPAMFLVGSASGILGLGGGVFIVPILTELMHLPVRKAVGTSVFMVGMNNAAAGVVYFLHGDVAVIPTSILAAGVFVGAMTGSALQHRLPEKILRRSFAILLAALAGRLLWSALG